MDERTGLTNEVCLNEWWGRGRDDGDGAQAAWISLQNVPTEWRHFQGWSCPMPAWASRSLAHSHSSHAQLLTAVASSRLPLSVISPFLSSLHRPCFGACSIFSSGVALDVCKQDFWHILLAFVATECCCCSSVAGDSSELGARMESEDDALDLLLSLQSDDSVVESPRPVLEVDGGSESIPVSTDVVEVGCVGLRTSGVTQHGAATLSTSNACSQTAAPSPPHMPLAPLTDPDGGYYSDETYERPKRNVTMAAFRDAVKNTLEKADCPAVVNINRPNMTGRLLPCNQVDVDQHSGLRIRERLVASATLNSRFCDLKFVRLQAIKLAGMAANFKGEWATVGVLAEKGLPKLSAAGKNFAIWKLASLDGAVISIFVFGDAYTQNWKESIGAVFAVFSAKVRLDEKSKQPSLSIFNANQMLKIGSSADFAVCKGKRVGGSPCTMVVNRRQHGEFCQHHLGAAYQKIKTKRAEISGGNLATAFSGPGTKRAQTVKAIPKSPPKEVKYTRPIKQLNSAELKKVLSTAENVTSNVHSQGMRFLETRSRHHYDQEQKLKTLKKKATTELSGTRKKPRVPLGEKLVNKSTLEKSQEPAKANLMELDFDEIDDDMEQARMFFASQGPQGLQAK